MPALAHPVRPASYIEINNFYTATVYEKGAELCRMLQTLLGRDGFRKGLDLYFERHDGEAATVEDFVAAMADTSGRDLSQFMLWYNQAGRQACRWAAALERPSCPSIRSCRRPRARRKEPMPIRSSSACLEPTAMSFLTLADGTTLGDGLIGDGSRQTFTFQNVPTRDAIAAARFLSAGPPHHQPRSGSDRISDDARFRSVQSMAGGTDLRHQSSHRRLPQWREQ
jgi:aminopeptidase N